MQYKFCPKCQQTLPVTCFYVSRCRKDGRRGECIACEADRIANWKVETGRTTKRRPPKDK